MLDARCSLLKTAHPATALELVGRWALGIGHWALGIARFPPSSVLHAGGFMNRSFACRVLTGLSLVAGGAAVMSASEPPFTTDVDVLVNGSPQTRFAYGGRWYVEALKGREY